MSSELDKTTKFEKVYPRPSTTSIIHQCPQPAKSRPLSSLSNISSILPSPQLSPLPNGTPPNGQMASKRRLFKNIVTASTPYHNIQSVSNTNPSQEQQILHGPPTVSRKRRLNELFGDIRDIDELSENDYDYITKKIKTKEERDLEQIEQILETRKQQLKSVNPLRLNEIDKLHALINFKMQNLSSSFPKYITLLIMFFICYLFKCFFLILDGRAYQS